MNCVRCNTPLTSTNRRARYCSSTCRASASIARSKAGTTPTLLAVREPVGGGDCHAATLRQLEEAGRAETALGVVALALAARIDRAEDNGSALASVAKQLEATLRSATAGAEVEQSSIDRLRARRDAKRFA